MRAQGRGHHASGPHVAGHLLPTEPGSPPRRAGLSSFPAQTQTQAPKGDAAKTEASKKEVPKQEASISKEELVRIALGSEITDERRNRFARRFRTRLRDALAMLQTPIDVVLIDCPAGIEQGFKITPVCPYVVVQFRRHPEWSDLLA